MLRNVFTSLSFTILLFTSFGQSFDYTVLLEPINIPGLTGVQSYAFAQSDNKWLVIGGRLDGVHARQPFAAFTEPYNNTNVFVIDAQNQQFWSAPLSTLPTSISEQLQSTNMNFRQDGDTLYIIGGYAFSTTANDHITFPNLTTVQVSSLIDDVINGTPIAGNFKQMTDTVFALSGGQLGKIDDTFYLVGGHRFDGAYNPMGNPTYTQTYSDGIRKFKINNSGASPSYSDYTVITDAVHLHRRDYNLLPQVYPSGEFGYTISSGVFQIAVDLPFLYPVDITATGYTPVTSFNQYLSNYHSSKAAIYDSINNTTHNLFFGGISQYYYDAGTLIQDNDVPFVKTISRVTRDASGNLSEHQLPVEMPGLKGAGAEFIINPNIPLIHEEIVHLSNIPDDTILIGHIFGGILSPELNPFANNNTGVTSADNSVYSVKLIKDTLASSYAIDGGNPYEMNVFPNPFVEDFRVKIDADNITDVVYFIESIDGKILQEGELEVTPQGSVDSEISISTSPQLLFLTIVINDRYYLTKEIQSH